MWRKASRLAGGRLPRSEERGAWAELYFMMLAAGLGMKVSRPFSNVGRYDVGVENQSRVLRVQVKSTIFKQHESKTSRQPKECYSLNVTGPQRQKYAPGTVDFFAILLIPIDEMVHHPLRRDRDYSVQHPLHAQEQTAEVWRVPRGLAFVAGNRVDDSGLR
jgi:hypothetical protein